MRIKYHIISQLIFEKNNKYKNSTKIYPERHGKYSHSGTEHTVKQTNFIAKYVLVPLDVRL